MTSSSSDNPGLTPFEDWANAYTRFQAYGHPSELHGSLCGRLALGGRPAQEEWINLVAEHMGLTPEVVAEANESVVLEAPVTTLMELKANDMDFQLLLPDDDYSLAQRLEALTAWVRGFLEGMAVTAGSKLGEAPEEIRELIEDLISISQASAEVDDSESDEHQLLEVSEYVRLGALAVYTEYNPPETPSMFSAEGGSSGTLH